MRQFRIWWPTGLAGRVRVAAVVAAAVLAAVFLVLVSASDQARDRDAQARHSADVLQAVNALREDVLDLETGLRGYIITRDPVFLEPYRRADATADGHGAQLAGLVADNPGQERTARLLRGEVRSFVDDYTDPTIATVRRGDPVGPAVLLAGKRRVDAIRAQLNTFQRVEAQLQEHRRAEAQSTARRSRLIVLMVLIVLVAGVALASLYVSRVVTRPAVRLERGARALAAGDLSARVETDAGGELGSLGRAFNTMADALEDQTRELARLGESSAAQLDAVFAQTPVGLALIDRELQIVRANAALVGLSGRGQDLAGGGLELLPLGPGSELAGAAERVLAGDPAETGRHIAQRGPERRVWEITVFPVRRDGGELVGAGLAVVDVTEREQRAAAERASAGRLAALEQLSAQLSGAVSNSDVTAAMVAPAVQACGGDFGALALFEPATETLALVASYGYPDSLDVLTDAGTPLSDSVRRRDLVAARTPAELAERYPGFEWPAPGEAAAVLALPLGDGHHVHGALAIGYSGEQSFDPAELDYARQVADRCAQALARAALWEREHEIADALQTSLLPATLPELPGVEFAARFEPAGSGIIVGGDFYDVFTLPSGEFVAWIGDVQGKGPEAAAIAALARYTLRAEARHHNSPAALLAAVNTALLARSATLDRFLTAACLTGRAHDAGLTVQISVAAHPPPLIVRPDHDCRELAVGGQLLGLPGSDFDETTIELAAGDTLVFYTDGLTDAQAPARILDADTLCAALDTLPRPPLADLVDRLLAEAHTDTGNPPRDDIAILAVRCADARDYARAERPLYSRFAQT